MNEQLDSVLGSEHFRAIRIFRLNIEELQLESLNNREIWLPGEIKESVCHHAKYHGKLLPEVDCTCGIWSCKSRKDLQNTFMMQPMFIDNKPYKPYKPDNRFSIWASRHHELFVSAQIQQWGVVIEHESGYRSEYARIIPETIAMYPRQMNHKKLVAALRKKYA